MLTTLVFITLTSAIYSQNWTGSFQIDSTCNTTYCCCFHGTLNLTRPSRNLLKLESSIYGQCNGFTRFIGTTVYPNNYTGYITMGVVELIFILNSDDNMITITTQLFGICDGKLYRNDGVTQYGTNMTFILIFVILFSFLN